MDLLSFLVSALEFVVTFAKVVAMVAFAACIGMIIKRLPMRIRNFVSAVAAALFIFAVFKALCAHQFALFALKTYIILYALSAVTSITLAFLTLIATFTTRDAFILYTNFDSLPKTNVGIQKQYKQKITFTSFFLNTSPIMLQ